MLTAQTFDQIALYIWLIVPAYIALRSRRPEISIGLAGVLFWLIGIIIGEALSGYDQEREGGLVDGIWCLLGLPFSLGYALSFAVLRHVFDESLAAIRKKKKKNAQSEALQTPQIARERAQLITRSLSPAEQAELLGGKDTHLEPPEDNIHITPP